MDLLGRLGDTWTGLGVAAVGTAALSLAVILLTRLTGPRSLATTSSADRGTTAVDEVLLQGVRGAEALR